MIDHQKTRRPRLEVLEDRILLASAVSQAFLGKLYQDLLGRPVDSTGLSFWSNYLDQGGSTSVVASQVVASTEYLTDQVTSLFKQILTRPPDAAGLNYFVAILQNGGTLEQVAADMAGSSEYFNKEAGGSYRSFLDGVYLDALSRGADSGGQQTYLAAMANGVSLSQVTTAIFTSTEHYQSLVQSLYQQLLGRPADAAGMNYYVAQLQQGSTDQAVTASIVSSDEYFNFNQFYIAQVYNDLFQRPADAGGLAYWTSFLDQGGSRSAMAQQFTQTYEYQTVQVQNAYETLLGRPADQNGLAAFVAQLQNGGTVEQVEAQIAGSAEYFQKRGGGTNDGFLDALYHDALNRVVDAPARTALDQALQSGTSTTQVAMSIFASGEHHQDLVGSLFQSLLGRQADSAGLNYFVNVLQQGAPQAQVVADLVGSAEYYADASNLALGEVDYSGPDPQSALVTFTDATGQQQQILAFPGQVEVFFDPATSQPLAAAAIQADGGSILGQIPRMGYYQVGAPAGQESAIISRFEADARVVDAGPEIIDSLFCDATILDYFPNNIPSLHGQKVIDNFEVYGGPAPQQFDITDPNNLSQGDLNLVIDGIMRAASNSLMIPTLVNLSSGNDTSSANWASSEYTILAAIASLPEQYRRNLVITISAGNHPIDINTPIDTFRHPANRVDGAAIADVLKNNVLFVTSAEFSNPTGPNDNPPKSHDQDVAVMSNPDSQDGTSFAAPYALGIICRMIDETGASAHDALQAAKQALNANANHELVFSEGMAQILKNGTNANLVVSPMSMTFSATIGGGNPHVQTLTLRNAGAQDSSLSYTINSNNSRLTVAGPLTPIPGGEASSLAVAFNAAGLAAGTYSATITIAAGINTVTVPVTLIVKDQPTISVDPTQLSFVAVQGGGIPSAQSFTITNTGSPTSALNFAVTQDASWINVTSLGHSSGSAASIGEQVGVNVAGLPSGTYHGTVAISDPNSTNLRSTVSVTLTILPPPPPGQTDPFAGSYAGTFNGTINDPLGQRQTNGQVAFTEANGIITVNAPGVGGSGTVDSAGNVSFVAMAPAGSAVPSIPFTGTFQTSPSGALFAGGTFSVTYDNGTGTESGQWSAFLQ